MAIADGPSGRRWLAVEGEIALRHMMPNWPLETKLVGGPLLEWLGLPAEVNSLRRELLEAGLPAVLAWHLCIGLALQHPRVTVTLDELITAIGWDPRTSSAREQMRSRWWRWLALFDSAQVIGRRPGQYRDPKSKQLLDLISIDALIRITGRRLPPQLALDDSAPPLEVSFVAGPWLDLYRGNHQVLSYFGDVLRLAAIPAGKPSGAWAQAIGFALQQIWRERAATVKLVRVGEPQKHLTAQFPPVTRRELLDAFPPTPTVQQILTSPNPRRARLYWTEAIGLLQHSKVIGFYRELGSVATRRQEWAAGWLSQPLDIRPGLEGTAAVAEIARSAEKAKKSRARHRPRTASLA
jgi:hypothetical protein